MIDIDTLVFFATQRSGHHAVMNWIMEQIPYQCNHYNQSHIETLKHRKKISKEYPGDKLKIINVYNFENPTDIKEILSNPFFEGKKVKSFIVLRDYYNTMASAFKGPKTKRREYIKNSWIYLAEKTINKEFNVILYNEWFKSSRYRKSICENLQIEYGEKGLKHVTKYGGGSSFDILTFDGEANRMHVLIRYEKYIKNQDYLDLCEDPIPKLNKELFGFKL